MFLLGAVPASAQTPDNLGTDFWLGFPNNAARSTELTLFITGPEATTGTVAIPGLAFTTPFTVTPGTVTSVPLPPDAQMSFGENTETKGVHVTAGKEVTVYGLNRSPATTDAYLGLPVDVLGMTQTVMAWGPGAIGNSEFSVVSTVDDTVVTITPSVAAAGHLAGTPYNVTLDQGQEYQLMSDGGDLTGTRVTSTAPVSIFAGHVCANIPNASTFACDHVVEQLAPDSTWGRSFLTVPLATRQNGDTFKFLASENGTQVQVNGVVVANLNAGEQHQQIIDGNSQIESNKPIFVSQFSNGSTYDGVTSDPFMMMIPPFEQFQTGYTISTPASGFDPNFVNLVVPNSAVGNVKVDGTAVPPGDYSPIGSSGYQGAQVDISQGSHNITGDGQPFGAFVYGFASFDSYGYPGGLLLAEVATVTTVDLTPETATNPVNTEHCVTAKVTDSNGDPVLGVRVDFTVSGANSASGSVNTDASGEAEFCYTGANAGDDTITGSVGALSDDVQKTWTSGPVTRGTMVGEGRLTQSSSVKLDYAYDRLNCVLAQNTAPKFAGKRNTTVFKVTKITAMSCTDDPAKTPANPTAEFDTMEGDAEGTVGSTAVTVHFKFVDGGTAGTNDSAFIEIKRVSDGAVLFSKGEAPIGSYGGGTRPGRNTAYPPGP